MSYQQAPTKHPSSSDDHDDLCLRVYDLIPDILALVKADPCCLEASYEIQLEYPVSVGFADVAAFLLPERIPVLFVEVKTPTDKQSGGDWLRQANFYSYNAGAETVFVVAHDVAPGVFRLLNRAGKKVVDIRTMTLLSQEDTVESVPQKELNREIILDALKKHGSIEKTHVLSLLSGPRADRYSLLAELRMAGQLAEFKRGLTVFLRAA
jgi:hypothetical protein